MASGVPIRKRPQSRPITQPKAEGCYFDVRMALIEAVTVSMVCIPSTDLTMPLAAERRTAAVSRGRPRGVS